MFFGLSNFLKNILPKRLFYRALLIVAVPVLVLQLVITVVFFDSLWIKTNTGMTRALINEINLFVEVYGNEETNKDELKNLFSLFIDLNIELVKNKNLENKKVGTVLASYISVRRQKCQHILNKEIVVWTTN